MKFYEFSVKNRGNPSHFLEFRRFALLGQAYAKWGPKSGPGGSKINPGGSPAAPESTHDGALRMCSEFVFVRCLSGGGPGCPQVHFSPQKGSQNDEKGRFFLQKSLQREVRERKLRFFFAKMRKCSKHRVARVQMAVRTIQNRQKSVEEGQKLR